jgi:hypothetical protein
VQQLRFQEWGEALDNNINETFEYIAKIEKENLILKLDQAEQQKYVQKLLNRIVELTDEKNSKD